MELTEDQIIEKNGRNCGHCGQNRLFPYEYEWTSITCGFNSIKRKNKLSKIQRRKTNFINRLNYAELKIFCICLFVYKIYEGDVYDKIYEVLSTLGNNNQK